MDDMETSFCSCDYEGPLPCPFEKRYHIARKEHVCCECCCTIKPGERYQYIGGKWADRWDHFKTCMTCANIRADYCAPYEYLRETLWEQLDVDYLGEWDQGDD